MKINTVIDQDTPAKDWGFSIIEKSAIIGAEAPGNFGYGAVASANENEVTVRFVTGTNQGRVSQYLPNWQSANFTGKSCAEVWRKITVALKRDPEVSWADSVHLAQKAIRDLIDYANE